MSSYRGVARAENQHETLAKSCPEIAGFEVLFPRVKANGRSLPLFANYLFIALGELGAGWHQVNRTLGVLRVIAFGDTPARVPDGEIESLRSRMCDGFITLPPPPGRRRFAKGDEAHITAGPFVGLNGLHTGMSAHAREIVLLNLLGRQTKVAVDRVLIAAR
jgi:transcriptional antiterminator RfaH